MRSDHTLRHILALCLSLIIVAVVSGLVMLYMMKATLDTLETDTIVLNNLKWQINEGATSIKEHLINAKSTIGHIINSPQSIDINNHDSADLGRLNQSIRDFTEFTPVDDLEQLSSDLDRLSADFVSLHYRAVNWRVEFDNANREVVLDELLSGTRDSLAQLQASLDAFGREYHDATLTENSDADFLLVESGISTSTIRSALVDVGRLVDEMVDARNEHELLAIRNNELRETLILLQEEIKNLADGFYVPEMSHVRRLFNTILGQGFTLSSDLQTINAGTGGLYQLLQDRQHQTSMRDILRNELESLTSQIDSSIKQVTNTTRISMEALDAESLTKSTAAWNRLLGIGLTSSAAFLVLVLFIFRALRHQIRLLMQLKNLAEDASEAKNRFMERLQDSETRHRTVVETMTGAVITLDEEGFIESLNPAAEQMFGYSAVEIVGRNIVSLLSQRCHDEYSRFRTEILQSPDPQRPEGNLETHGLRKDGSEFPLSLSISEMMIEGRRMYTGIVMDISERQEYEARLLEEKEKAEHSNHAKSDFLATMSHEIRTPMNSIIGMSQLLLRSELDKQQQRFAINIHDSGEVLLGIINDILDLSRIEAKRLELQNSYFDLVNLLEKTTGCLADIASLKGIKLDCDYPVDLKRIWFGDKKHIEQVINNLLSNAIKFTRKGSVTLSLTPEASTGRETHMLFTVEDTGIGIARDAQEKIFESFSQADGTTTREYGGSGLGLTICSKLVGMMGGEIGVDSTPGQGSRFWFRLALERGTEDNLETVRPVPAGNQLPAIEARILLVEDNQVNQEVALHMLESLSCKVKLASDGIEALTLLNGEHFDAVLMDCQMPRMDGYEASMAIRRLEAEKGGTSHLPVIALTANAMNFDREHCTAAGMDDYISKPVTIEKLANALSAALPDNDPAAARAVYLPDLQANADVTQSVNASFLDAYRDLQDGDTLLERVIGVYLEEAPVAIRNLQTAIQKDDPDALCRAAHKFKSSNMQLGAEHMTELCAQLDKLGRLGITMGGQAILADMQLELVSVKNSLEPYRSSQALITAEPA